MAVVLDTSILIAAERTNVQFGRLLESLGDESVGIAAITASELLHGCHRANSAATRARRSAFVEAALAIIPIFPFGLSEARRHADVWADLGRKGTIISPHDLLIAATALAHGASLATLNSSEFRRVPGLRLVAIGKYRDP